MTARDKAAVLIGVSLNQLVALLALCIAASLIPKYGNVLSACMVGVLVLQAWLMLVVVRQQPLRRVYNKSKHRQRKVRRGRRNSVLRVGF